MRGGTGKHVSSLKESLAIMPSDYDDENIDACRNYQRNGTCPKRYIVRNVFFGIEHEGEIKNAHVHDVM